MCSIVTLSFNQSCSSVVFYVVVCSFVSAERREETMMCDEIFYKTYNVTRVQNKHITSKSWNNMTIIAHGNNCNDINRYTIAAYDMNKTSKIIILQQLTKTYKLTIIIVRTSITSYHISMPCTINIIIIIIRSCSPSSSSSSSWYNSSLMFIIIVFILIIVEMIMIVLNFNCYWCNNIYWKTWLQ